MSDEALYAAIARNLREFGYGDVTAQMIADTDAASKSGAAKNEPHGIISMFANGQLESARDADEA